jgi:hypothetical protein
VCGFALQDDGTVLVLYSSTTHHKCRPQPRAWWQWFAPIRASVRCALLVVTTARCHAVYLACNFGQWLSVA